MRNGLKGVEIYNYSSLRYSIPSSAKLSFVTGLLNLIVFLETLKKAFLKSPVKPIFSTNLFRSFTDGKPVPFLISSIDLS